MKKCKKKMKQKINKKKETNEILKVYKKIVLTREYEKRGGR